MLRELVLEMLQHLVPVTLARGNDGLLQIKAKHLCRLFDALDPAVDRPLGLAAMRHVLVDPRAV